jgi:hypothetical protein
MTSLVAAVLLGLAVAPPQATPDFSGRWVLRSGAATPETARVLVVEQPITSRNVRGEAMPPAYLQITIRREGDAGVTTETHRIGVLGGSVGGVRGSGGRAPSAHQEAVWEGDTLVFSGGSYTGNSPGTGTWTERREVWSLSADGTLTIERSLDGSDVVRQRQRATYVRQ